MAAILAVQRASDCSFEWVGDVVAVVWLQSIVGTFLGVLLFEYTCVFVIAQLSVVLMSLHVAVGIWL